MCSVSLTLVLTLVGGLCLLIGLLAALLQNHYAAMRGLIAAKNPLKSGSLAESPRARADRWFYVFLSLTILGVVLQTAAAVYALLQP